MLRWDLGCVSGQTIHQTIGGWVESTLDNIKDDHVQRQKQAEIDKRFQQTQKNRERQKEEWAKKSTT